MYTMWDAPSDRDYQEQFMMERDDEAPENEPVPLDPAAPDIQRRPVTAVQRQTIPEVA